MNIRITYSAVGILALLVILSSPITPVKLGPETLTLSKTDDAVSMAVSRIPLHFEANEGQFDEKVRFAMRSTGCTFFFTPEEMAVVLSPSALGADGALPLMLPTSEERAVSSIHQQMALKVRFVDAPGSARIEGHDLLPGKVSYIIGNDPVHWQQSLPTYASLLYRDLYPHTDLRFYGLQGRLKYDLVLRPGAGVESIAFAYEGAEGIRVNLAGQLEILTPWGIMLEEAPEAWQEGIAGEKEAVDVRFEVLSKGHLGFAVGPYDLARPLIIDPTLRYSTFVGGGGADIGRAVAVDDTGNVTVIGYTDSTDFPSTTGVFEPDHNSGTDAFVFRLDKDGNGLLFSTFLGGSGAEAAYGLALDSLDRPVITGYTNSVDFPTTPGAYDRGYKGGESDVWILRLTSDGTALSYGTYVGGTQDELGHAVQIDSAGNTVITGRTNSSNFPTTEGAYDVTHNGSHDVFVLKLAPDGGSLLFSTFLGGSKTDYGRALELDGADNIVVTGFSESSNYPTTASAYDRTFGNEWDIFVSKLNEEGDALLQSTFVGDSGTEEGLALALDESWNVFITGQTSSTNFPTTFNAHSRDHSGTVDAFVLKLAPDLSTLQYSTLIGGSSTDIGYGLSLSSDSNVILVGRTDSPDFPTTSDALDRGFNGGRDAFVLKLALGNGSLAYSSYVGGSGNEFARALALHGDSAVTTGYVESPSFPTTGGAFDSTHNGDSDVFVLRLDGIGGKEEFCYSLTTDADPSYAGWIATTPLPDCDAGRYTAGSQVKLSANAAQGYAFNHWSGDASGNTNPTTISMDANKSVTAVFSDENTFAAFLPIIQFSNRLP